MNLILGIDTGGTYTDGVLMDHATKKVLASAKAFTTREDLSVGIKNCMNLLNPEKFGSICLVSLSTTLATNAVVEKKETPVGLITIGESKKELYPATVSASLSGKLDVMGREIRPVMEDEARNALNGMKGRIKALAVSGYASVRNPQQELFVCDLAKRIIDVPVVCAYELTSSLGFYERTVTAVLNAKLIPIITELIAKTKETLRGKNIDAPVIIVKGDGHLMTDSFASEHPVETVLSGPAASAIGGRFLTGLDEAIIVDMGGTTTDIVFLNRGEVSVKEEGASVGGWQTRVKAVEVKSHGFGGDSYMRLDSKGEIKFEPYRVIPFCVAAERFPYLSEEVRSLHKGKEYMLVNRMETDCFHIFKREIPMEIELGEMEKEILMLLEKGPHSALYLADKLGTDIDSLDIDRLMDMELIQMISMTPTDVLHALGEFRQWDHEASILGMKIYAQAQNKEYREFLKETENACIYRLCYLIMQSVLEADGLNMNQCGEDIVRFIIDSLLGFQKEGNLRCDSSFIKPIIGIGAPAEAWIRKAAQALNTPYILPEYESVANAVGAAVSDVKESVEAFIHMDPHIGKYVAFLPRKKESFDTLEEAKAYCRVDVRQCAEILAAKLLVASPEIVLKEEDEYIESMCGGEKVFVKTSVKANIVGEIAMETEVCSALRK